MDCKAGKGNEMADRWSVQKTKPRSRVIFRFRNRAFAFNFLKVIPFLPQSGHGHMMVLLYLYFCNPQSWPTKNHFESQRPISLNV